MGESEQLGFFFDAPDAPEAPAASVERARVSAPTRRPPVDTSATAASPHSTDEPSAASEAGPRRPPTVEPGGARTLADALGARLGAPVTLVITDNRTAMFSARKRDGRIHVRANHVFLDAGPAVIDAMAAAIQRVPGARATLREFLRQHKAAIRPTFRKPKRRVHTRTRGAHHDLAAIFLDLEQAYFPDAMTGVAITWGPRPSRRRRRRRRSIQLGLYIPDDKLIRIHRALDQAWVPRFYVESVVFHEMLHHCMPPVRRGNQVVFHTPQFRALEKVFPHHQEAERWEKAHLDRLLST